MNAKTNKARIKEREGNKISMRRKPRPERSFRYYATTAKQKSAWEEGRFAPIAADTLLTRRKNI